MKHTYSRRYVAGPIRVLSLLATLHGTLYFASAASAQPAADATQGKATAERWCNECHVIGPGGRGSDIAPNFATIARDRDDVYLRGFLIRPHPPMPRFELSRQDINDLVAYFDSLRAR